jgi:hypothetical protein
MKLTHLDDGPKFKELSFRSALVIEEVDALRCRIVHLLRRRGWIVHGLRQAEQTLPILTQKPYHLIVIDSGGFAAADTRFGRPPTATCTTVNG